MCMSTNCNGKLLISGTDAAAFSIDAGTGVLKTTVPVKVATKPKYSVDIIATGTVTGSGKVALTVDVKADCNAATQMTAAIGILLLSLMTALYM